MGLLDYLGRTVIADMRVECGGGGEGGLRVPLQHLLVGLDALDALLVERTGGG